LVVASRGGPAAHAHRALPQAPERVTHIIAALAPPIFLLAFTGLLFFGELTGGPIAYGRDTTAFYYPLTEWTTGELRQGRLPLWLPLIFGGYPLLADGEVGPLYPPDLALFVTLPMPQAYAWMRALHYGIAALGTYVLARILGAGGFGATIGGLSFAYGSFLVGHLQHDNILRSASWLPWLLAAAELALRHEGRRRIWAILGGAVVYALMSLGVHIQPVLLSTLALGAYLLAGPLVRPSGGAIAGASRDAWASIRRWLLARCVVGFGTVGLGGLLAAAQLVPLYVLGSRSLRPALVTYDYATSYAISPVQMLTLVLPYMFHFDAERHWALWSPHESTLYVGVGTLVLALVGTAFVRTRAVVFFAALGAISLTLCLGDYLPIKPYSLIWNLPGFAYLRAPARFSLLFELAVACLAALAATWLERRARGHAPRALGALLLGTSGAAILVILGLQGLRWWLQREPSAAIDLFNVVYVQTSKENWQLGPWHVYYGLLELTRPGNPRTLLGIGLLAVVPLLIRGWFWRPDFAHGWRLILIALVAVDLWLFAGAFHLRADPHQFRASSPAVSVVEAQPGQSRLFVEPSLNSSLGPNLLVRHGIATINGYSSLEPPRYTDYLWSVVGQDNFLLDIFNVRYVLAARSPPGQRLFAGTSYHTVDRLLSAEASGVARGESFVVPPTRVAGLTVIGAVDPIGEVAPDTPAVEVILTGAGGEQQVLPILAGRDLGEYLSREPGRPTAGYAGPMVIWAGRSFVPRGVGPPARLYAAQLPVDPPFDVVGVTVNVTLPAGRVHLHGLGLQAPDGGVYSVRSSDRAKYQLIYEDVNLLALENASATPRVYLADGAVRATADVPVLDQLARAQWDPRREILVEGVAPSDVREAPADGPVGAVELLSYEPGRVVARAELTSPGYLVLADRYDAGWRAWSGGQELPIIRANSIQQAVLLRAGAHTVELVYDPWWIKLGFGLSALGTVVLVAVSVISLVGRRVGRVAIRG
jgi:hypothetical protein